MYNYPANPELAKLEAEHASAVKKRTSGIILTAIGVDFLISGLITIWYYGIGVIFWIAMLPLLGIGIPNLIIGITNASKLNRRISQIKAQIKSENATYQIPAQQPVNYVEQNTSAAPVMEQAPQVAVNTAPQAADTVMQATVDTAPQGVVPLDWQKYAPLDAGVSYNPNKDYKFHRAEGFAGSAPQTFVNRTFPKCPICCTSNPYWTISQHNQMSWKGNLYLFKCSCCDAIISMSMPDVTTLSNGGVGVAANPSVGLTNLMVKASSGKEAGAVYAVIESVGKSGVTPECQGKEFKLENLQDMFLRM